MASSSVPSSGDIVLRLDLLPNELLSHIFSFLVPSMPDLGETRPVAYDKLIPEEPWYEPTRCRAALRASCLVSRKLRDIAEHYQYHNIALLTERQFVCFLTTLTTRHEDISKWNRYFAVHLTLNDTEVYTEIWERFKALPPGTWSLSTNETLKGLLLFRRKKIDSEWLRIIPECLLMAMLTVLEKAETFLLQVPVSEIEDQPQYTTMLETFHLNKTQSLGQNLRKLLIQTDPEILAIIHDDIEAHGEPGITASSAGAYWPLLLHCPNITTIEVSHDDGNWCTSGHQQSLFCLQTGGCPCQLRRMKHVYLNDSYANPQTIADLLAHMPALETLYVDPKWSEDNEAWMDVPVHRTLDDSLLQHGRNLRRLDLGFRDCSDAMLSIGEDGYLTCLPRLLKIEQLHIQLALLFPEAPEIASSFSSNPNSTTSQPTIDPTASTTMPFSLSQRLPPNVTDLTLEDWWWRPHQRPDRRLPPEDAEPYELARYYHNTANVIHRRAIVAGLLRFASEVGGGSMPKLRKVVFLVRSGDLWTLREPRSVKNSKAAKDPRLFFQEMELNWPNGMSTSAQFSSRMSLAELADMAYPMGMPAELERLVSESLARAQAQVVGGDGDVDMDRDENRGSAEVLAARRAKRQLITGPSTLREHLAEVEGMFVRLGIEFEVSEM